MTAADATRTSEVVGDREIVFTRRFEAARPLVFKAWTESDHLMQWWGPREWPLAVSKMDLRPGGVWHYCMRSTDGQESWGKATYREIVEPERLVYVDAFSDPEGNSIAPEATVTITFAESNGGTLVSIHTLYENPADRDRVVEMGVMPGMSETLDRLAEHLARL
jgi:uncharacterized protein YndB with AHSA1/START domain